MFATASRRQRELGVARDVVSQLAELLDSRVSVRLWDGTVLPLGGTVEPGLEVSISGPGVIGSLLRRPTASNLLQHFAAGHIDYHGAELLPFLETARVRNSRRRTRQIRKSLLARLAWTFLPARQFHAAGPKAYPGDETGRRPATRDNGSFIRFHYDVGNEFYQLFLDPLMVYSCAYFHDPLESLEVAQRNKLEMICRKLRLRPGERLLDIGCGWGGLICYAAQHYGVSAHGITLSERQLEFARNQIEALGLSGRVSVELADYSQVEAPFDKVASIGMVEHVGIDNMPNYMRKIYSLLPDRGLFLNHGITRPAKHNRRSFRRMTTERRLLNRYIFPGGELDHLGHLTECMEAAGFEVHDVEGWRQHYAMTCRHWAHRLEARRDDAVRLVGREQYRLWQLYLAGVGLALADGTAGIYQTLASKRASKGLSGMPLTRAALYDHEVPHRTQ